MIAPTKSPLTKRQHTMGKNIFVDWGTVLIFVSLIVLNIGLFYCIREIQYKPISTPLSVQDSGDNNE